MSPSATLFNIFLRSIISDVPEEHNREKAESLLARDFAAFEAVPEDRRN